MSFDSDRLIDRSGTFPEFADTAPSDWNALDGGKFEFKTVPSQVDSGRFVEELVGRRFLREHLRVVGIALSSELEPAVGES